MTDEQEPVWLTDDEEEDLLLAEDDPPPVVYSGQDFDIVGLVRRINNEDMLVPTFGHHDERIAVAGFQRAFVWTRPQMDRFIESLLLGYPIPGIFLVRQPDKRYLVLDGQQRLRTLAYFYEGVYDGREFALNNVGDRFRGLTYRALHGEQRRTLDNAFIQATIVTIDNSYQSLDSVYQIFERLNSGGTKLTPHEIRVALYAGPFVDFLEELNGLPGWRALYGRPSPRIRDQELILRIMAMYYDGNQYYRPLKSFLNAFTAANRHKSSSEYARFKDHFEEACNLLNEGPGRNAVRPRSSQINAALTEAVLVAMIKRLRHGFSLTSEEVTEAMQKVNKSRQMVSATSTSTASEESVRSRLAIAASLFRVD
ncbi:DUF262 domain-containing protein [Amycolatopsis sp. NPDC051371]|uniref:DUF262 domain-containing protein n=1 Tax=Amycolatopsis sp. NPDC051371 TaxID=3155800 RepID=UPI0034209806